MPSSSSAAMPTPSSRDRRCNDRRPRRVRLAPRTRAAARRRRASRAARWSPGSRRSAGSALRPPGSTPARPARRRAIACAGSRSGLFCSSVAVSVSDRRDVHPRRPAALRPRVGEEAADRLVQSLRLAHHDVHQLRLLAGQRQLLTQHLDRAGHRRQRVADLVGDAGGHLADRGEPLLDARLALVRATR